MTVLEMMKKDVQSVVGLTVDYDYGGAKSLVDVIANGRVSEYNFTLDGEPHIGKIYMISFMSCPWSFYGVYKDNVKVQQSA